VISRVGKEHYSLWTPARNSVLCRGQQGTVSENGHISTCDKFL